ncbi:hypothetical protein PJI16_05340 [Nitrospira sp. MA-1]|nr:hypothetical protein [Nitrospira sp. MA-1]
MMTEVIPFHIPFPSSAVTVNPPIRHPGIKSLQGFGHTSFYQQYQEKGRQSCGKLFYLQDSTEQ